MEYRIGNGYDVHKLAEGLPLVLAGVKIDYTRGCVAHSDGDVAIHALCDALLGSLALGDIGQHFPDTCDKYKGIDSKILLSEVCKMLSQASYRVVNVDITILAQKPKLAPYVYLMRSVLCQILEVDISAVSVKATTTESLGFVGREEGIAVYATALVASLD